MTTDLVFMMGQFEAHFPTDRCYARNHMWAMPLGDRFRFGFSAYAVRLLQDVYFLDLTIENGMQLTERQEIGSIESKKAESSLYCPIAGKVVGLNQQLLDDPSAINVDKYGDGWLFELQGDQSKLLDPQAYLQHLTAAWEVAQKTIKGQANL
jgi:glycine cleavage system H protein